MHWFLLLLPLVALAGLAQVVYSLGNLARRWRRLVAGLALMLMLFPVWLLTARGSVPRASTVLWLVPTGSGSPPELSNSASSTAQLTVEGKDDLDKSPLIVNWRSRSGQSHGIVPSAGIYGDWSRIAKASLMPGIAALTHGIAPKPIVAVVDNGSNSLDGIDAQQIDVSKASMSLKKEGATFYRLKVDGDGMGGGRLDLAVRGISNARILATMSTKIDIALVGCPFKAKGDYRLRAWLDAPIDPKKPAKASFEDKLIETSNTTEETEADLNNPQKSKMSRRLAVGQKLSDRRSTLLPLYDFTDNDNNKSLSPGFHEVRVELSFETMIDGIEVPLLYRASVYIEIVERKVVVFSGISKADDFMRHSWVHRSMSKEDNKVPSSAGALLKDLETLGINSPRTPFTNVEVLPNDVKNEVLNKALDNAAMLVVVEPTFAELKRIDSVVREYTKRGNSVLLVVPPTPEAGDTTSFAWLPALSDPQEPIVRGDPRIYLLPDTSRPASFIRLPTAQNATGAVLQHKLFNAIAEQLAVYSPYDSSEKPILLNHDKEKNRLLVNPAVKSVLRSDFEKGGWSVIPPIFMRSNETTKLTTDNYSIPLRGAICDLAPSWVTARLGMLSKDLRVNLSSKTPEMAFPDQTKADLKPEDLDLPLDNNSNFPNTCIVVTALDVPQALVRQEVSVDFWMHAVSQSDSLPNFFDLKKLVEGGAKVIVIPIQLHPGYTSDLERGAYSNKLFSDEKVNTFQNLNMLKENMLKENAKIILTQPLKLDATDGDLQTVIQQILQEIKATIPNRRSLQWKREASARAVDHRTTTPINLTFAYRPLKITAIAKGIDASAYIQAGDKNHPVLIAMPFEQGVVTVIGFNPFSFDRWLEERAHKPNEGKCDGWGLQRLIDPVSRMSGNIGTGTVIESLRMSDDRRFLNISCRVPQSGGVILPDLKPINMKEDKSETSKPKELPKLLVTVLGYDFLSGRLELAISVNGEQPVDGAYEFVWPTASVSPAATSLPATHSSVQLYVSLAGQLDPAGDVRERLDRIAFQTGGGVVNLDQFKSVLDSTRFDGRLLGSCLVIALTALLLSPAARPWNNPFLLLVWIIQRRNKLPDPEADADDEADAVAALDSGGLSYGQPTAQRPAGPILQLRQMRPGDSAAAVPASRWILFIPEIADMIGSPPLPYVYETPRPQAMSILTILDLHTGADAHDLGAQKDRIRVMKRIAMLNAAASLRRGGSHRLTSLQARENTEQTEASSPDQVAQRIATLHSSISNHPEIPELLENELVIFVTNPASMSDDELLRRLARDCGENLCSLTALVLIHPSQVTELGLRFLNNPFTLFDRGDLDSSLIEQFHADRAEAIAAALGIIESRTVTIYCDQSTDAIAKVLEEEAWTRV